MASNAPMEPGVAEIAEILYQALAAAGHAGYCPARLGPIYDEGSSRWGRPDPAWACTCGRDKALARYESWRHAR
ncbi:MAG TPA: hypothetical protein VMV23_01540 [Candidatus Nanopelagicaceae bacterium]|nr:hypothetical protein [Candidatus Nanopelagicaceae bacterium]